MFSIKTTAPYNASDIARYIINYSADKENYVNNLKLQKLLYFVQAYYIALTKDHKPCFRQPILAWDYGPVVEEVYNEYHDMGDTFIPPVKTYLEPNKRKGCIPIIKEYDSSIIKDADKENIREVVDEFSDYSPRQIMELTHQQEPWKKAMSKGRNSVIELNDIREFFEG